MYTHRRIDPCVSATYCALKFEPVFFGVSALSPACLRRTLYLSRPAASWLLFFFCFQFFQDLQDNQRNAIVLEDKIDNLEVKLKVFPESVLYISLRCLDLDGNDDDVRTASESVI